MLDTQGIPKDAYTKKLVERYYDATHPVKIRPDEKHLEVRFSSCVSEKERSLIKTVGIYVNGQVYEPEKTAAENGIVEGSIIMIRKQVI